jgi:hypothetical protein
MQNCPDTATHEWGKVHFCCNHFDGLVAALYDLNEAVAKRQHTELVELYETRMGRPSRMHDMDCLMGNAPKRELLRTPEPDADDENGGKK